MKNIKKIIAIAVIIGLAAIVFITLKTNKEISEDKIYQFDKEKAITVDVDTVQLQKIEDLQQFTGTFQPDKESKISAEIQGKIDAVFVDEGDYVEKGQKLIQLDHSLLKLQLQSVEVQIQSLQDDVNRYTILADSNAIQGVKHEKAKIGLASAKIQKSTLEEKIRKSTVRAPFRGVITAKLNDEGAFASPGMPLLQITAIDYLRFTIAVTEDEIMRFQTHQTYPISVDAFS